MLGLPPYMAGGGLGTCYPADEVKEQLKPPINRTKFLWLGGGLVAAMPWRQLHGGSPRLPGGAWWRQRTLPAALAQRVDAAVRSNRCTS